jgi:hypothetical protein
MWWGIGIIGGFCERRHVEAILRDDAQLYLREHSPTSTIAANLRSFKELTGINVNVLQLELQTLVQKIALDTGSGEGSYQIVYADPYQVLAPFHAALGPHARRGHWRVKAMRLLKKGRGSATRLRGG